MNMSTASPVDPAPEPSNQPMPVVRAETFEQLDTEDLIRRFSEHGRVVLRGLPVLSDTLYLVAGLFGDLQLHERSQRSGIVNVSVGADSADESVFKGVSDRAFDSHTDGTYLDGYIPLGSGLLRVQQPAVVLLQCERPAESGGTSFTVDGEAVLKRVIAEEPGLASTLFTPESISYCRSELTALRAPVFETMGDSGRIRMRFRFDETCYVASWARAAVQRFKDFYLDDTRFRTSIDLISGDILIVDNQRSTHGRTRIRGGIRELRRMWVAATADIERGDYYERVAAAASSPAGWDCYSNYRVLPSIFPPSEQLCWTGGIRLTNGEMQIINDIVGMSTR